MAADDKRDYDGYLENVKQVHQNGKYGSIGYRSPWSEEESLRYAAIIPTGISKGCKLTQRRLVLRTHTTAISAAMLHQLAGTGVDGTTPPARYFSIDRVFR